MQAQVRTFTLALTLALPVGVQAAIVNSGFDWTGSGTGGADIGFGINFFDNTSNPYSSLFINENGNVTFGAASNVSTDDLGQENIPIIAPFFESIDASSGSITFGKGLFDSKSAFGVTWEDVTYGGDGFGSTGNNSFQLLLVDRYDSSVDSSSEGDFDIVFNYGEVSWDEDPFGLTGEGARVGFADAQGKASGEFFQLPGSATPGTFLDTGTFPLVENHSNVGDITTDYFRSTDGGMDGRFVYQFRSTFDSTQPVPTPSTLALLGLGLISFAALRRRSLPASLNHA